MTHYLNLEKRMKEISQLNNIASIIQWDNACYMPPDSSDSRHAEIATLSKIIHNMWKDNSINELIIQNELEIHKLDRWQIANIREIKKRHLEASWIDETLQSKYVKATTQCEYVWRKARKNNDYKTFKPYFEKVLIYARDIAKIKAEKMSCSVYDAALDYYDPGRKSAELKTTYSLLQKQLPGLVQNIIEKQKNEIILPMPFIDVNKQKAICHFIMEKLGFNFNKGRIDEGVHPQCSGTPYDLRIITKFEPDNLINSIMSAIHECGHAFYEQNLPSLYLDQPVGNARGMAVHESQSLIIEMQLGRSRAFAEFLAKIFKDNFNLAGPVYSGENIYKLMNRVKAGLIRIDSDEVTYPMHVILRFEIETLLMDGELLLDELPSYWNKKMKEYLDITPLNDTDGCMQDIHWPSGYFGYFPAYTNGAIIASMLMKKFKAVQLNIAQKITNGEFVHLNEFLKENIHKYGSLKSVKDLIKGVTGDESINANCFIDYLSEKYLGN